MGRPKGSPNKQRKEAVRVGMTLASDVVALAEAHRERDGLPTFTAAVESLARAGAKRLKVEAKSGSLSRSHPQSAAAAAGP